VYWYKLKLKRGETVDRVLGDIYKIFVEFKVHRKRAELGEIVMAKRPGYVLAVYHKADPEKKLEFEISEKGDKITVTRNGLLDRYSTLFEMVFEAYLAGREAAQR